MEFKLRSWNLNDLESLVRYANNYNIAKNLTNQFPHPYTKENGESFIAMATKNDPLTIFAIEINGQVAGGIGLHLQQDIHCKNAELGYWLAEPFWGKGIITRAIMLIVAYGFKTFEIDRIFARPFGYNLGSQKVLTKSGFLLEGKFEKTIYKFGEYQDELIYAVRK
jgi:RimJ/RimL family protein N-acetyltransferase